MPNPVKSKSKPETKTRAEAIAELVDAGKLTAEQQEDLSYLNLSFRRGQAQHPVYPQWRKMVDGCTDPRSKYWPAFGGKGVTVIPKWMDFDTFLADMGPTWDDDESKPENFRRIYIGRANLRAGFNPKNAVWITQPEAMQVQARTHYVKTPFGGVDASDGKMMTLRELEKYLIDHAGEDFPEGCGPFRIWMRQYDFDAGRFTAAQAVEVTSISPIKLTELRRRYNKGLTGADLVRPTRPYGDTSDRIESEHVARMETERKRRERAAAEKGMTLAEYDLTHLPDGTPFEWGSIQHPLNQGKIDLTKLRGV